jgi:two-component system sensor histidine kinase VicK
MVEEKTDVLDDAENILKFTLDRLEATQEKLDGCYDYLGPSRVVKIEPIRQACMRLGERGVRVRYLTDIKKENLSYCKEILKIKHLEMRHMDGVKGNFAIEDGEGTYLVAHAFEKEAEPVKHAIYSTVKGIVEPQQYLFDNLWSKALPAEYRFRELEEGIIPDVVEILRDPYEIQRLTFELIKSAKDEILIMYSMSSSFLRQQKIGSMDLLLGAALLRKVRVKILTSVNEEIKDWHRKIGHIGEIEIRNIEPLLETRMTILVVDKKFSLVTEVKDDSKETSYEAVGLASYSTSKLTVSGYASIFEALWKESELHKEVTKLYEEARIRNISQREFITVVAHELRNPLQPIIGLSEALRSRESSSRRTSDTTKEDEMLDVIARNANRLRLLTEAILDITRIETKTLKLNKEDFNLKDVIKSVVQDYQNEIRKSGKHIELLSCYDDATELVNNNNNLKIVADQNRIFQVICNLVNNAIRFTNEGTISITATTSKNGDSGKHVTVSVKDCGTGFDPEFLPQLFTKFATKSDDGTGLGLFICRNIVEAHGGRIWAENNVDGIGATVSFTLPFRDVIALVDNLQEYIQEKNVGSN